MPVPKTLIFKNQNVDKLKIYCIIKDRTSMSY